MHEDYIIHIIDDDAAVRDAVAKLVESIGLNPVSHQSAESFISTFDAKIPSILILDVRMNGMGGLELQEWLIDRNIQLPVIIISGHGDIPMAVEVIQKGAIDFIEKPFRNQTLLDRISKAIKLDIQARKSFSEQSKFNTLYDELTDREKEVCNYIVEGLRSKEIAKKMNVSHRTIEGHRSSILKKMNAKTSQELLVNLLQIEKSQNDLSV